MARLLPSPVEEVLGLLSDNIFLRTFLPGQCIFSDGDTGEFIFILTLGEFI